MNDSGLKKAILIGASAGALFSIGIAVSLDYFLADSLRGTWWDAATKDVTKIFGPGCGGNPFAVGLVLFFTMAVLAGIGAFFGLVGSVILYKFFTRVLK